MQFIIEQPIFWGSYKQDDSGIYPEYSKKNPSGVAKIREKRSVLTGFNSRILMAKEIFLEAKCLLEILESMTITILKATLYFRDDIDSIQPTFFEKVSIVRIQLKLK